MQYKFEILKKGDTVLNVWENKIAIKKKSGEVEIFQFNYDEDRCPRLEKDTILITLGNGVVKIKSDINSVEIGTF